MDTKDKISLTLSISALFLSIFATVNSQKKSIDERQITIRAQLTDVLGKLTSLQLESAKIQHEAKDDREYLNAVSGVLGQQNGFVLDQAVYLSEQVPTLVTTYELNTIAFANANVGNFLIAEKYYLRAIEIAPNDLYRTMAIRSYGAFLYPQGRLKEGRDNFRKALELKGEDNMVKFTNGFTYQMWALNELHFARSPVVANAHFESAQREYSSIDVDFIKNMALENLKTARKGPGEQQSLRNSAWTPPANEFMTDP